VSTKEFLGVFIKMKNKRNVQDLYNVMIKSKYDSTYFYANLFEMLGHLNGFGKLN